MLHINKLYEITQRLKLVFILIAIAIVLVSTLFTNRLAKSLAAEELKKIEIWAEATRQIIVADENTNINFISKIIEENNSIPIIMTDDKGQMLFSRNIEEPKSKVNEFYEKEVARLKAKHPGIEIKLDNTVQYIYYDDSVFLKQLYYFPYVQLGVIIIFLLVAFFAFAGTKKAEQNQVWVGLSKETAHHP